MTVPPTYKLWWFPSLDTVGAKIISPMAPQRFGVTFKKEDLHLEFLHLTSALFQSESDSYE